MTSVRLAARLARREVVRRPWRTLLVALLVAVPVAGMTTAAVVMRTANLTGTEQFALNHGDADLVVHDTESLPDEALPSGTETVTFREDWMLARTIDDRRFRGVVTDLPLDDPMAARLVRITEGRRPSAPGEMLLSPSAARKLEVSVGDTVTFDRPAPTTLTVTGIGERRSDLGERTIVLADAADWPRWNEYVVPMHLVDLPDTMSDLEVRAVVDSLVLRGVGLSAAIWEQDSGGTDESVRWSWVIGAVVLTVFGIVIASAFAAGARRQLTTLGQIAANGGAPRVLRQVLFLQGTWTGVIGALLGVALGGIGLVALAPHIDRLLNNDVGAWEFRPSDLVPIVGLGVVAATIAALVPARTTSRVPVLAALAGRRPLGQVPARVTTTGFALGAGGLALLGLAVLGSNDSASDVWAITAIVGGVAVLFGACAVTPRYVSLLEPSAGRTRGSWRLAARSLARQRTRTAAVVSGVCAAAALAVAASSLVLTIDADNNDNSEGRRDDIVVMRSITWREPVAPVDSSVAVINEKEQYETQPALLVSPPPEALVDEVRTIVPDADVVRLLAVDSTNLAWPWVTVGTTDAPMSDGEAELFDGRVESMAVADDHLLDLYELGDDARRDLRDVGAVLVARTTGTATVVVGRFGRDPVEFDATMIDHEPPSWALPTLILTPERASDLGFTSVPAAVAFDAPTALNDDQRERVSEAIDIYREDVEFTAVADQLTTASVEAEFYWPSEGPSPLLLEALLSAGALLFTLFVVAVSLALAAAETRDERDVLAIVGAPPAVMRRTSSRKAVLLAALGAMLAIPVGFLPVVVYAMAVENSVPLVFPWRTVFLLAIVVPLVAGALTSLGSAVAMRLRPVRVSSMAFE